ncbi:MAG TPA: hypothetical protein VLJ18_02930 [Thermoanaerobaculia bacterium]|nr:hypothetical protein [Thermoanaerobaculia bacterium]
MRSSKKNVSSRILPALAAMALLLAGCNDSSPTEPKLAGVPTPTPASQGIWSLAAQVTAATGGFCVYLPTVGSVLRTTFVVHRSGSSVSFLMADPMDWTSYTATSNGANFTASIAAFDSGSSMCTHYRQMQSLSGSFSEDGNHLSATEVWSFTLDSGEVVTRTFSWSANRG